MTIADKEWLILSAANPKSVKDGGDTLEKG